MKWRRVPNALQDQNNVNTDLSITCILGFQSRVMLHALWTAENWDVFNSFSPNFRKLLHLLSLMKTFYIHVLFFLHSFSRWVRVMIVAVALETYFSQVSFFSNKAEFANPFYHIRCTRPLLLFYTGHTNTAGQCKVFQLTLIPLTFWEPLSSVFCMYTALTTENSMRLWLAHLWYPR